MNVEEVAKRAKVSTATVSRVLNNVGPVKNSTRTRVLRAVAELKYQPNIHARTLAGGKSRTLGMVVSNLENPFFLDVFRTMEAEAHKNGYEVVVANTDYQAEQLVKSIRLMIARRVAGLAIIVSETDPRLTEELSHNNVPVMLYDVGAPSEKASNIRVNYGGGVEKAVEYLYTLGHRRIAFVSHHATLGPLSVREQAFRKTVSQYAPEVSWRSAVNIDGLEGGRMAARELLNSGFDPTAIVCVNDFMALGALREIRERGLRVPQDVSVTGFDNIKLSEFSFPSLTTLHIDREAIGRLAFQALVSGPETGSSVGRETTLETELVIRDSTGPAQA
jgi:LacI family transcriptional regulator, galactose operon repressor